MRVVKYQHYKQPRRINVVSIAVVAVLGLLSYLVYRYAPRYFMQQEVYRVLEEHGSEFAGQAKHFLAHKDKLEHIEQKMRIAVQNVGVRDPDLEVWIEVDGKDVVFAASYLWSERWPMDVLPPESKVYNVEHVVQVR